ncbi:MAG: prephenate dehydrogenase/arogenate dehydrogenase family protein [Cardiobacteriaceae bacterium]|nr:prephenate dehydrogenase/arogenate dehydrogenase family protein [Cardiobacteriaceae bacterium]
MNNSLGTVAFVGMGLIGGSLAMALGQSGLAARIVAVDQSKAALAEALALGVIDEAVEIPALAAADVIVLATPVDALFAVCADLAKVDLKPDVVITDVGSTKGSVLDAMRAAFGDVPPWFVPAHPIAGREKSGVRAAEADLFAGRKVILTTLPETDNRALGIVSRLWHAAGALTTYMSIDEHDEILGATSHLPHVLAYLLVDMLDQDLHHEAIFSYAAGGFRDFTRIASSSPVMWRDVCVHNADVLRDLLAQYRARIERFEALLAAGDGAAIETVFARAKAARDAHYDKEQNI